MMVHVSCTNFRSRRYREERPVIRADPEDLELSGRTQNPVTIDRFQEHVDKLHKDTNMLFAAEYEQLKVGTSLFCALFFFCVLCIVSASTFGQR